MGKGANDQFEYASRLDYGPYIALNLSLFGGVIKIGGSATHLRRKELYGESDTSVKINEDNLDYRKGTFNYVVGGAKLTFPIVWLPTLAFSLYNTAKDDFKSKGNNQVPEKIKQTSVVGLSVTPQIGRRIRIHWEVNYKDLSKEFDDVEDTRRWTGGFEIDMSRKFFIRLGYGDGYGSAGFGVKSRRFEMDITTYAVDTTAKSWRGKEDRRFVFTFSSGI